MPAIPRASLRPCAGGALACALFGCAIGTGVEPELSPRSVSLLYGPRTLDDGWSPGAEQSAWGALVEFHHLEPGPQLGPHFLSGVEFGALRGTDTGGGHLETLLEEFFIGQHAETRPIPVGPVALLLSGGLGVTWVQGETDAGRDDALGVYAQCGARVWLGGVTTLGLAARWTQTDDLMIGGARLDTTYVQGLLVLGWNF